MEFYNESRFRNWLEKIKEIEVKEDDAETFAVFDQMVEDFVIVCLNLIRSVREREIKKGDAIKEIERIQKLINDPIDLNSDLKNTLYDFSIESVRAVLASFKLFLEGKVSKKSFQSLIDDAVKKEKAGDVEGAFELIARMGAKVIKGEKLPELEVPDDGLVLNWLDGVDAINAAIELSEIDAPSE
jgi:hypothetical protein